MELGVLKKKISSFKGDGGRIKGVSDDLLLEILSSWENWTGTAKSFYRSIGVSQRGMASMLGKAKRLKREGHTSAFEEISVEGVTSSTSLSGPSINCDIELQENNKVIRFRKVDLLIEYLKKGCLRCSAQER